MTHKLTKIIKSHKGRLTALGTSEGLLASSSEDTTLKVFDIVTFKLLITYTYHKMCINDLKIVARAIYSCGDDHRIKSVDLGTNKVVQDYFGHTQSVTTIDVHETLASGSADKSVRLWDVRTGKETLTLRGHSDIVTRVVNREKVISSSMDGCIRIWDKRNGRTVHFETGVRAFCEGPDGLYVVLRDRVVVLDAAFERVRTYDIVGVRSILVWDSDCFYVGCDGALGVSVCSKLATVECTGSIDCIAARGRYVFCGGSNKTINVVEIGD